MNRNTAQFAEKQKRRLFYYLLRIVKNEPKNMDREKITTTKMVENEFKFTVHVLPSIHTKVYN